MKKDSNSKVATSPASSAKTIRRKPKESAASKKVSLPKPSASSDAAPRPAKKHAEKKVAGAKKLSPKILPQKTAKPKAIVKPEPIPVRPEPIIWDDSGDFAALLGEHEPAAQPDINVGDKVLVTLVYLSKESAFFAVGQKSEGVMPVSELMDDEGNLTLKVGESTEVFVLSAHGEIRLTKKLGAKNINKELLEDALLNGMPVEGKVEAVNKGGFEISLAGTKAFCPLGQMDIAHFDEPEKFIGSTFAFMVKSISENGRNVVLSRRQLQENERIDREGDFAQKYEIGDELEGRVSRIMGFGAFVEAGGVEGLIPISELSYGHVFAVEDVLSVGDLVKVQLKNIGADPKREGRLRIGFSLKAAMADPFIENGDAIVVGASLQGKVVRLTKFGAFVELFPGIDGMIHISEMSQKRIKSPEDLLSVGDVVAVRVLDFDQESQRISLTLRDYDSEQSDQKGGDSVTQFISKQNKAKSSLGTFGDLFRDKL